MRRLIADQLTLNPTDAVPPIPILYEEPHFLLVDKPAGLFTQAAPGVPSLETALARQLKARDEHPGCPFVGLPHRLDRATSGVLLIARNQRALGKFGQQFQSRKISKFYIALVHGLVPMDTVATWSDYLRKIPDVPKAELVAADAEQAKLAELKIEAIAHGNDQSLVVVELLTGRMHQIRLQLAARGFPVLGDLLYGVEEASSSQRVDLLSDLADNPTLEISTEESVVEPSVQAELFAARESPHALHAFRLGFFHPQNAKAITCTAPLPASWGKWLQLDEASIAAGLAASRLLAGQLPP